MLKFYYNSSIVEYFFQNFQVFIPIYNVATSKIYNISYLQ